MDIPDVLIELQRRFFAADAECERDTAGLPPAVDEAGNVPGLTAEQSRVLAEARAARLNLVEEIHGHGWWKTVGNRHEAREALRAAGRA